MPVMPAVWMVPAGVLAIGAIAVVVAASRATGEARRLLDGLRGWHDVRPALVEVRSEADELRARLEELRRR